MPTLPACPAPGGIPCDDGDPCTDDACIAGVCDNAPLSGIDGVTCACDAPLPATCLVQQIPTRVQRLATRGCRFFAQAVDAPPRRQRRRLRQGARALRRALNAVVHAQIRGLAPECAAPLAAQYRGASDRASLLADTL